MHTVTFSETGELGQQETLPEDSGSVTFVDTATETGFIQSISLNGKRIYVTARLVQGTIERDAGPSDTKGPADREDCIPAEKGGSIRTSVPLENILIETLREGRGPLDPRFRNIFYLGAKMFHDVAPPLTPKLTTSSRIFPFRTLHSKFYPETHYFELKTINGEPQTFPSTKEQALHDLAHEDIRISSSDIDIDPDLPQYSSLDVYYNPASRVVTWGATDVLANQARMVFMRPYSLRARQIENDASVLNWDCYLAGSMEREQSFILPKLTGYVVHPEEGDILGVLFEWLGDRERAAWAWRSNEERVEWVAEGRQFRAQQVP